MKVLTYVGCYTDEKKEGIHIFESDTETGAFRPVGLVGGIENAIYLSLNKARTRLYAGLGLPEFGARNVNGAVAAYAIQGDTLLPLNHKPIGVTPPCSSRSLPTRSHSFSPSTPTRSPASLN